VQHGYPRGPLPARPVRGPSTIDEAAPWDQSSIGWARRASCDHTFIPARPRSLSSVFPELSFDGGIPDDTFDPQPGGNAATPHLISGEYQKDDRTLLVRFHLADAQWFVRLGT